MGIISSKESPPALESAPERPESVISSKMHGRQASVRQSTIRAKSKQPMPDPNELERRFTKVLVSFLVSSLTIFYLRKNRFCGGGLEDILPMEFVFIMRR